jgi:hypothetical protein
MPGPIIRDHRDNAPEWKIWPYTIVNGYKVPNYPRDTKPLALNNGQGGTTVTSTPR